MCVQARVDCNDLCRAASGHFGLQADRPQQLADAGPTRPAQIDPERSIDVSRCAGYRPGLAINASFSCPSNPADS